MNSADERARHFVEPRQQRGGGEQQRDDAVTRRLATIDEHHSPGHRPQHGESGGTQRRLRRDMGRDAVGEQHRHQWQGHEIALVNALQPRRVVAAAAEDHASPLDDRHGDVQTHQQIDQRLHDRVIFRPVVLLRPAEKHRAGQREQKAQMDEHTPAARQHHQQHQHAQHEIVTTDHQWPGVVDAKGRGGVSPEHAEHRHRCSLGRQREYRHRRGYQHQQGQPGEIVQITEQRKRAVSGEISHTRRRPGQREMQTALLRTTMQARRKKSENRRQHHPGRQFDVGGHIGVDEHVAQQRADTQHHQCRTDLGRPVVGREPRPQAALRILEAQGAILGLIGQHAYEQHHDAAYEGQSCHLLALLWNASGRGPRPLTHCHRCSSRRFAACL